jgi:PAS domain S-box-containing protein
MSQHSQRTHGETRTERTRVLLLIEQADNSLSDWVQSQNDYEAVSGTALSGTASFDICLCDSAGFHRHERELLEQAATRPVVLVLPEDTPESQRSWDAVDREFDGVVDDVVRTPFLDVNLRSTIERTLGLYQERKAHQETRTRLQQFTRAVDVMSHALYVTDTDGTIEFVNPAFTEMTGYEPAEAIGKTPALLKSGYHDAEYYSRLWETLSAGNVWREPVVNERKNGDRYHAEQTIVPVTGADNSIQSYVAVQTDVTRRINRTTQLEVLDRILRHNLRNDISVIQGEASLLAEKLTDGRETHAEAILSKSQELIDRADKEREIVQFLLDNQSRTEQNLSELIRRVVGRVSRRYRHATVSGTIPDGLRWPTSPKLDRAVEELLVNGIVHNDSQQPRVSLTVTRQPESVEIVVTDNGPGIPEAETAILTGSDSVDQLLHGTGLGLWLVYWIVHYSGGTLGFEPKSAGGSVVTIRLPGDVEAQNQPQRWDVQ